VCFVCVHDLTTRRMGTATGDGKIVRRESGEFETATYSNKWSIQSGFFLHLYDLYSVHNVDFRAEVDLLY
jgi:hypothetical protein